MNRLFRLALLPLLAALLAFSGCQKYEDGPTFSLSSRAKRATGNWVAMGLSRNEISVLDRYAVFNLQLFADGRAVWRIQQLTDLVLVESGATWELFNLDQEIKLTFDQPDPVSGEIRLLFLTIRRMTGKELWLEYQVNGDRWRVQFKPA